MHLVFYFVADGRGDTSCPQERMNDLESSQFILDDVGLAHKEALWNSKVQHPEKNVFSISQRVRSSRLFKHEHAV